MSFSPRAATLALLALLCSASALRADGGAIRLQQTAGAFTVTVFTPEPLRAGPADVSVLVQTADGATVLDATVDLTLAPPDTAPPLHVRATREEATNKLLLAATVDLDRAGTWTLDAEIRRGDERARVSGDLLVGAPLPRLQRLWPYLALPPAVILLFALGQWLAARRAAPLQSPKRSR